jgi:hypothetical protein
MYVCGSLDKDHGQHVLRYATHVRMRTYTCAFGWEIEKIDLQHRWHKLLHSELAPLPHELTGKATSQVILMSLLVQNKHTSAPVHAICNRLNYKTAAAWGIYLLNACCGCR